MVTRFATSWQEVSLRVSTDVGRWALLALVFISTRILIMLSLGLSQVSFVANDVSYYGYHLFHLEQGKPGVMQEYPVPAVWLLQAIYTLGGGWQSWAPVYAAVFLVLDAAVAVSLVRRGNISGALFWVLFTGANGAIVWYRFDLIPAALVAWSCLLLLTRPAVAGGLIGMGAAIKLWPALLIGPMVAPRRSRVAVRRLLGFLVVGLGLGVASLVTSGWDRSASPITWQSDRGLQIESVPATPLMFLRSFTDNPSWHVFLSDYNALELEGPGVGIMLHVSTVLTVLAVLLAVFLTAWLVYRLPRGDDQSSLEAIILGVNTIVLAMIVANKTLSPQYVLWLGGPVAALLVFSRSAWLRRHLHVLAGALIVIGALTQATYPWLTYGIMAIPTGAAPETAVLILRNVALVVLTGYSLALTLRVAKL